MSSFNDKQNAFRDDAGKIPVDLGVSDEIARRVLMNANGRTFFADPADNTGFASDDNGGQSATDPFATLQAAIDTCEDERGDVIIRMRGYEAMTTPLLLNKKGVTIIAATFGNNTRNAEDFATHNTGTTGPAVIVSQRCHLHGQTFATNNVTTPGDGRANNAGTNSAAAIYFLGEGGSFNGGFSTLSSCRVPDWIGGAVWGIEFGAGAYNLITHCSFEGLTAGVVTGGTASNNPIDNTVEYCRFNQLTDGIRALPGTTQDMSIHANNFMAVSGSIVNENGQGGLRNSITDNWAQEADSAAYNQAVGSMITDGWTPSGNHYVES